MRITEEQVVIGGDLCQRKCVRLGVIVKVIEEVVDIGGMLLMTKLRLWIFGDCLTTSRKRDSTDKKRLA